ncbi:MAG: hypothetical protein ACFE8N_06210 [Promethearchaeota archaeon]
MIRKRFTTNWAFECPEAVLTCSVLKCGDRNFLVFGGHDRTLYLMDDTMNILDDREFDGWCRCSYTIDFDGDGCDEVLVGAGDGTFMIMKLNKEKNRLIGLMRYRASKKINCCIAGDFTQNGNVEFIIGGEDKTVKIFDSLQATEPKFVLYYDSWVITCALGYLLIPEKRDPIYGLVVGTKNGQVQLIQIQDGVPDIVWDQNFNSQINDIKIGDVTNDGLNEILLSTDDSSIKILSSVGEVLKEIESEESRPLSLLIEDIDGDNANEIVAGYADGSLKVFHNPSINSYDFELKWKTKVSTSIKNVSCLVGGEQKHIVFGGYDRSIRDVTDFEWGQKQKLEIPSQITIPEIQSSEETSTIEDLTKIEEVPTNIREHIFKIMKEKDFIKDLAKDLQDLGYSQEQILNELDIMITQKSVIFEKVVYPIWSLVGEEAKEKAEAEKKIEEQEVSVKHMVIEEPIKTDKEKLMVALMQDSASLSPKPKDIVDNANNLKEIVLTYLENKKLVITKTQFVEDIIAKGFAKSEVEKEINLLKEQGKIIYSRAKPKGWSLSK